MIRLARSEDAVQVAAIYAPFVTGSATSFEYSPPDAAETAARIASTLAYAPYLVSEVGGGVLGFAYASKHRDRAAYQWSVDVSVYIHERARRQGVGRTLYTSLFALLRLQGFYTAHAGISLPNPASGPARSAGFQPVGVYRSVGFKHGPGTTSAGSSFRCGRGRARPTRRGRWRRRSGIRSGDRRSRPARPESYPSRDG